MIARFTRGWKVGFIAMLDLKDKEGKEGKEA